MNQPEGRFAKLSRDLNPNPNLNPNLARVRPFVLSDLKPVQSLLLSRVIGFPSRSRLAEQQQHVLCPRAVMFPPRPVSQLRAPGPDPIKASGQSGLI